MDPQLKEAACSGNVEFLVQAHAQHPIEYFLSRWTGPQEKHAPAGNILHIAAKNQRTHFIEEAIRILPADTVKCLLSQQEELNKRKNPLHIAAQKVDLDIVKLILNFFKSTTNTDACEPWLARDADGNNPLQVAMGRWNCEECVVEMLSMDMEPLTSMVDKDGQSPLFVAVLRGFQRIALEILGSGCSYSISGDKDGANLLHMISLCSENVGKLLLERYAGLLDLYTQSGASALHYWAKHGYVWPLNLLLSEFPTLKKKVFMQLINSADNNAGNPLHSAVGYEKTEFLRVLVDGYLLEVAAEQITGPQHISTPLRMKGSGGKTPLHLAITSQLEELALYILSVDSQSCKICNDNGESPLFQAVEIGCEQVVEEILRLEYPGFDMLCRNDGQTVLHALSNQPAAGEKICKLLIEQFWWLTKVRDTEDKTAVEQAREKGYLRLVRMLDPSMVPRTPFNWIDACKKGDVQSICTYIENWPADFQRDCLEKMDSPLHHIKLRSYVEYQDFVRKPLIAELKNALDREGATPLHRAIQHKDLHFAQVLLLEQGVDRTIKDENGTTAMDMLSSCCQTYPEWEVMCNRIGVHPYLKPTYIQPYKTNLAEMRGTLSIVAALLATITFAAGFTLPGGVDSTTGEAVRAKKAAFIIFLLADCYAMCTSMLVLFCLIWSMVSDPVMSMLLLDRSVLILMQSLYGTLVTFMTGVFTVVSHKTLWPTIVIFVMCSLIGLAANRKVLYTIVTMISKFIPAASREQQDPMRLLEQGRALTMGRVASQKAE